MNKIYRDPLLGRAKTEDLCECGCGTPHKLSSSVVIENPVTHDRTVHWFATMSCANTWRRKEGML